MSHLASRQQSEGNDPSCGKRHNGRHAIGAQPRMASKLPLHGQLLKTMSHTRFDRGMTLIEFGSRCVPKGEIHELVSTDQHDATPGSRIDRVGFIGFMEAHNAGVIEIGDRFYLGEHFIGTVLGFDDCHFPNHYNILIATPRLQTAADIQGARPGMALRFEESI